MSTRLDAMLKDAARITDDELRTLSLDGEAALLDAIMAEPAPQPAARGAGGRAAQPQRAARRRLLVRAVAGAAATAAIALAGVSLTNDGGVQTGPDHAWAAQALEVAGTVPRLVVGAPGWEVARADEFTVDEGELTFSKASQQITLLWFPARMHAQMVAGAAKSMTRLDDADVRGRPAALFRYAPPTDLFTAVWRMGKYTFVLRSDRYPDDAMSRARFEQLLRSLRPVSVDEWLSAMPAIAVLPAARKATVQAMLSDIPLPPGFDATSLEAGSMVNDRYQLGARVTAAVTCAWIGQWVDARKAGDAAAERAALNAVEGSRDWAVLNEMKARGDWPDAVQGLADAMAGRAPVVGGRDGLTVEGTYRQTLGCEGG